VWDVQVVLLQPKRAASDVVISKYSYLRVHAQPKRFPAAYSVDWQVSCLVLYPAFSYSMYLHASEPQDLPTSPIYLIYCS